MRIPSFFLLASLGLVAACTVTSTPAPVAAADPDAGTPEELPAEGADAGVDAAPVKPTKVGEDCTKTGVCSEGQSCVGVSAKGQHICMTTCATRSQCSGMEKCKSGVCFPTCDKGCPSAMQCFGSGIPDCFFDCKANPRLCGSGETCNGNYECVPTPTQVTCAPGGGAAASGVTSTKTVGSLTSTEQGTFCDWAAAVTGGYACSKTCGATTVRFSADKSACIAQFTKPGCAATIAQAEACIKDNATDVCALKIATSAACAELRACL